MSFRYILHESAQADYEASLKWYLERSEKAAGKFVTAVDAGIKLICDNPTRWRNKYKKFYEVNLKKFPFTIVYSIEKEQVIAITAIYHHKRNPKKKYRRR